MKAFFEEIWKAVSDFKFYKEAKKFPVGKSFKYILSLMLLISLVLSIGYSFALSKGLDAAVKWMKKNLPVIEIQNGAAKVDVEQPYKIEQDEFAVIIDTTGKVTSLDGYKKGMLLMKDKVIYKESETKTEIYNLADIKSLRIDENFMNAIKKNAAWILFPFILVGTYLYLAIARLFQVVIFSVVTIFASTVAKARLEYKEIFNIGVYAVTLSTILGAIAALFVKQIPGFGFVYAAIYITYLVAAVMNCKELA